MRPWMIIVPVAIILIVLRLLLFPRVSGTGRLWLIIVVLLIIIVVVLRLVLNVHI